MPENKKPQTGKAFLKTHTTEEIADLISSGHPIRLSRRKFTAMRQAATIAGWHG